MIAKLLTGAKQYQLIFSLELTGVNFKMLLAQESYLNSRQRPFLRPMTDSLRGRSITLPLEEAVSRFLFCFRHSILNLAFGSKPCGGNEQNPPKIYGDVQLLFVD